MPNKILFKLLVVCCLIMATTLSSSAQNFPVLVEGNLVPPNNVRFGDYFTDDGNNLIFTIFLNDPLKKTRDVRLRLVIQTNFSDIAANPLNFTSPVITLDKEMPELIFGDDLNLYFEGLVGLNGNNIPKFLPEGFNGICIEVVDIETGKVISNTGCAQGTFNLAQPPQLQSPVCDMDLEYSETPNILFNWLPMHNASGVPIGDVEYVFYMVKMDPWIQNPKDAFDAANYHHTETILNTTSFTYTDSEPILEEDTKYAWRVEARALDINGDYLPLFQNNGISEICQFSYLKPPPPPDPISFSSCTGNQCGYPGSIDNSPKGQDYFTGDKVKLGFFELQLDKANYNSADESYSGDGSVYVDFLGTNIKVEFNDIKINSNDRVFRGELEAVKVAETVIPSSFVGDFAPINPALPQTVSFSADEAESLLSFFNTNPTQKVSNLRQDGKSGFAGLPVGLDAPVSGTGEEAIIVITDMFFTSTQAVLNTVHVKKEGDQWISFGAKGVCFRQNGLVESEPKLFILDDIEIKGENGFNIVLEPKNSGGEGTYMEWDCQGFSTYNLQGRHELDKDKIIASGSDVAAVRFSTKSKSLSDFKAPLVSATPFHLAGLPGFDFTDPKGWIDFSKTKKITEENLSDYEGELPDFAADWTGVFISESDLVLPELFSIVSDGELERIQAPISGILLDGTGVSGEIKTSSLVDGYVDLSGMPISLDALELKWDKNELISSQLSGKIKLPIFNEDEPLTFTGYALNEDNIEGGQMPGGWALAINSEDIKSDLLRSSFSLGEGSVIEIRNQGGIFSGPKISLNGKFTIDIPTVDEAFGEEFNEDLQIFLNSIGEDQAADFVNELGAVDIPFENLTLDFSKDVKLSLPDYTDFLPEIDFLGIASELDKLNIKELDPLSGSASAMDADIKDVGLVFTTKLFEETLGDVAPDISFILRLEEDASNGLKYDLKGFELDGNLPEFDMPNIDVSCSSELPEIDMSNQMPTKSVIGFSTLKIGYFDIIEFKDNIKSVGVGRYKGEGVIKVDALGTLGNLKVKFDNVLVNTEGRIVEGVVSTIEDEMLAGVQISEKPTEFVQSVQDKIDQGTALANEMLSLPVAFGNAAGTSTGMIVSSLDFLPQKANLSGSVILAVGDGKYAEFSASGLNIVPEGIAGADLKLGLKNNVNYILAEGYPTLEFIKNTGSEGSFVTIDCDGLVEFNLQGNFVLPSSDYLNITNPDNSVKAGFNIRTEEWGDFFGEVVVEDDFGVRSIPDMVFRANEAVIDFSNLKNPEGIVFPEGYTETDRNWKGIYLPQLKIDIPESMTGSKFSNLETSHLLIDDKGVSAALEAVGLLGLQAGDIGGWKASIDTLVLTIKENVLEEGMFTGGIQLPIMSGEESMPYVAFAKSEGDDYQINFEARPKEVDISLLQARIQFDDESILTVGRENGEWKLPFADLSGKIRYRSR